MDCKCRCHAGAATITTIIKTIWTDDGSAVTDVVAIISIVIIMKRHVVAVIVAMTAMPLRDRCGGRPGLLDVGDDALAYIVRLNCSCRY
jgi:hypothetical protein